MTPHESFLPKWHRIVDEKDLAGLHAILAEDVALGAPPYWNELAGRDLVAHLLGIIIHTIEGFTYQREWQDGGELALEFKGHVGEHELQGVDLISLDDEGRIRRIEVPMRPVNSVVALREAVAPKMAAYLAERG